MIPRHFSVLLIVMLCGSAGCKPIVQQFGKHFAQKIRVTSTKTASARPASSGIAQQLSHNADDVTHLAFRTTQVVSNSSTLGQRLVALHAKIPANAYLTLFQLWLKNDAELKSYARQLQDSSLDSDRRSRLEQKLEQAIAEQAEIERLVEQYG